MANINWCTSFTSSSYSSFRFKTTFVKFFLINNFLFLFSENIGLTSGGIKILDFDNSMKIDYQKQKFDDGGAGAPLYQRKLEHPDAKK